VVAGLGGERHNRRRVVDRADQHERGWRAE
jgi:hypothetical protein